MKKVMLFLIIMFSLVLFVGCDEKPNSEPEPEGEKPTSIEIEGEKAEIEIGESIEIIVTVLPETAVNILYEVSSSAPDVLKVEGDKLEGLKKGEATVTITALGNRKIKKEFKVLVYDGEENKQYYDISLKGDNSVIAVSKKKGSFYELTINGNGEVKSYTQEELVPWYGISKTIKSVIIEDGIENIGDYYFHSLNLDSYIIPKTVQKIEKNSFNENAKIYSYRSEPFENSSTNEVFYYYEQFKKGPNEYWHMVDGAPTIWKDGYKVMFIGNSFTFYPLTIEKPAVVEIAKSLTLDLGINVEYDFVVQSSYTLKQFANKYDPQGRTVFTKLKNSSDYDFIILQEQSSVVIDNYYSFSQSVSTLLNRINETQENCEVILYSTWGPGRYSSKETAEKLTRDANQKCADEFGLRISHVGKAFTYINQNYKNIPLYSSDNHHQNYVGSFLSACVHVCTLFDVDVRESSFRGALSDYAANIVKNVSYEVVHGDK